MDVSFRKQKVGFVSIVLSIAAGMGGELYLHVPGMGTLAMLDIVSYAIAIPVICAKWSRMGKWMRRSFIWAFAWTLAAMVANFVNFHIFQYWLKCVVVVSSSWAIMASAYLLLKDRPLCYVWYLVGAGIGGWIGLHYFRNGAYAAVAQMNGVSARDTSMFIEKQVYPFVARGIFYGCILPMVLWWKKFPPLLVIGGSMFCGFYLLMHGGSRSNFGVFCAASAFGFCVAYSTTLIRNVAKKPLMLLLIAFIGGSLAFGVYKYMAISGKMGEGEAEKLEAEFGKEGHGAINGRAGFDYAFAAALKSGGIGTGEHLRCHSVMANALHCEGFIGFMFWLFFYAQILWFVGKRLPYTGKYSTFVLVMILSAAWDAFGSPFGTRHKFFVLMAFVALCRDNPYYGVGKLFDPKMLEGMRIGWFRR